MIKAVPKAKEYGDTLIDILSSGQKLEEWELHTWIRDIKKLKDNANESYLLALSYAAGGKKEKAILHFEESLFNDDDGVSATNYITYIAAEGDVDDYLKVSSKLADMYVSREMYGYAYYMHIHCGKIREAIEYAKKFIKVSPNGEDETMQQQSAYLESKLRDFKKYSKMSNAQFDLLSGAMAKIMRKHKVSSACYYFHTVREESVNAYVVTLTNVELNQVAQMNFELAFELADHDELLGMHVGAWFEIERFKESKRTVSLTHSGKN